MSKYIKEATERRDIIISEQPSGEFVNYFCIYLCI